MFSCGKCPPGFLGWVESNIHAGNIGLAVMIPLSTKLQADMELIVHFLWGRKPSSKYFPAFLSINRCVVGETICYADPAGQRRQLYPVNYRYVSFMPSSC